MVKKISPKLPKSPKRLRGGLSNLKTQSGFLRLSKSLLITYLIIFFAFSSIAGLFLFNPFGTKETEAAWFNDNWAYRQRIPIDTHTASETNVYNAISVDTATLTTDKLQADCDDLRFTKVNGDILPYQIVSGCDSATTVINVGFDTMPIAPFNIYMYYGNPQASIGSTTLTHAACGNGCAEGTFASEEKAPSPVIYWKFDESSGTTAQDTTTNNIDGTLSGSPTILTEDQCISGKCLRLNGSGGSEKFVYSNSTTMPGSINNYTLSIWFKARSVGGRIIGYSTAQTGLSVSYDRQIYLTDAGRIYFDSNTSTSQSPSGTSYADGKWHQIVGVLDTSNIYLYIDGNLVDSDSQSSTEGITGYWRVGYDEISGELDSPTNDFVNGDVDEVKIYNQTLTAAQVLANYNARSNPEGVSAALGANTTNMPGALSSGLVGYWKMDETATPSLDSSGNSNSGTWTNSPTSTTGKFGNAASFAGSNQHINAGSGSSLDDLAQLTVSAWIYPTTISGDHHIARKGTSGNGWSFQQRDNVLNFQVDCSGGAYQGGGQSNVPLVANTWQHVTVTWTGTCSESGAIQVYVNSVSQSALSNPASGTYNSDASQDLRIGIEGDGTSNDFEGRIDELRIYRRVLSSAELSQLYNWAPGPVGYWKFDEGTGTSAFDSSGNNITGTLSNSPVYTSGKFGKALSYTSGSSQTVTMDTPDALQLSTYTFSFWVKSPNPADTSPQEAVVVKRGTSGENFSFNWRHGSGSFNQACTHYASPSYVPAKLTTSLQANTWYHITCTYDGTNLKAYLNGKLETTAAAGSPDTGDSFFSTGGAWGAGNYFTGIIDDLKIYSYARTPAQIIEDMNAGHPAPGSPVGTPILHHRFDEGADNMCSGGTNDVCNYGNGGNTYDGTSTADRTNAGKFNKALDFVSTNGDVVTIANNTAIDMDGNLATHTFSAWVYADSDGENDTGQIYSKSAAATDETYLRLDSESGGLDVECNLDRATTDTNVNVADAFNISTWNHVACSWDGTTLRVYVNGLERGSSSSGSGAIDADSHDLLIGGGTADNFDGKIDEFKVYNAALTADQIKLDMNRGSSQVLGALSSSSDAQPNAASNEYCPPDSATAVCTGPIAELKLDEKTGQTLNDSSGNSNTGTRGSTGGSDSDDPGWTNGKYNGALSFDGSDDFASIEDASSLRVGSGDLTIEAWIYPKAFGSYNALFDKSLFNGTTREYHLAINSPGTDGWVAIGSPGDQGTAISFSPGFSTGSWQHVALRRSGSTVQVYRNGQLVGTATQAGTTTQTSCCVYIGRASAGDLWNGKMDQFRIFDYARTPAQIAWSYNKGKPIAHWRMDECQGTTIYDSSGNGNSGTWEGSGGGNTAVGTCSTSGARFNGVTGKRNYSLDFDGGDDNVDLAMVSPTSLTGTFSITVWVNPDTTTNGKIIGSRTPSDNGFDMAIGNGTGVTSAIGNGSSWITTSASGSFTYSAGTWIMVTIVVTPTGYTFYANGRQVGSGSYSGTPLLFDATHTPAIGIADCGCQEEPFNGKIDDLRIFNYALTATQIKSIYNEGAYRIGPTTGAP